MVVFCATNATLLFSYRLKRKKVCFLRENSFDIEQYLWYNGGIESIRAQEPRLPIGQTVLYARAEDFGRGE